MKRILMMLALTAMPLKAQQVQPAPQQQQQPACTVAAHKQFDFWVGEWNVFNAQGQQIGRNTISRVAGGCGLLEEWTAAGGGSGKSINFYDPADGQWHQVWVGGDGTVLRIAGALRNGAMQLTGGDRKTPRGTVRDRITWTPQPDGAVEQSWEISTDGGANWQSAFVGVYRRK